MTREECLDKAKDSVCGHRLTDYGIPEDNFAIVAEYWNTYLFAKGFGTIKAHDVANMMCLLKLARITTGTATDDSYVDLCGYAACGAELKKPNPATKME